MDPTPSLDRAWITSELIKGIEAERSLAADAKARAEAPPDPALAVLYLEIAAADECHATIVETIAVRYGYTPVAPASGGIGRAWGRLKGAVSDLGSSALDHMSFDLATKARSIHWYAAWVAAFEAVGDAASAGELATVLAQEEAHQDALGRAFRRLVEQRVRGAANIEE